MRDEVEKGLLAKLMHNKNVYYNHFNILNTDLFCTEINREIFTCIDLLYQQGNKFDILLALQVSNKTKKWIKKVEFEYQIMSTLSFDSYHLSAENCIKFLIDETKKERFTNLIQELPLKLEEGEVNEVIDYTISSVTKLTEHKQDSLADMSKQIDSFLLEVKENCNKTGITGITSGFESIDNHTNGWKKQDLIIVGGASSMGKTSLSLGLALNAAKSKIPSVIFSYEMSSNQLLTRLVSSESGVENKEISSGLLDQDQFDIIVDTSTRIKSLPLFVDECSNTSLRYLLNRIRRYVITNDIQLVMIDYLQLINNFSKGRSREQEVSQIARSLKNIAKELNICVIALSQLSRNVQNRAGCKPCLADLRESGEIEQAADTVVFVYRPEYYGIDRDEDGNDLKGKAEIIFAKGRNIGIGNISLEFSNKFTKFDEPKVNYSKEFFKIESS